jgi:DNA-binding NtrC family response regulator
MPSGTNGIRKHRLLIGEAKPAVRDYLLAVLGADGHEVVAMASGVDLLDTLAVSLHPEFGSGHFDLVISEVRLLGAEEARVFSEFKDRTRIPPFILTTAFRDKDLQVKVNQFGALAVLDKPLDVAELRQVVSTFLHHSAEDRDSLDIVGVPAFGPGALPLLPLLSGRARNLTPSPPAPTVSVVLASSVTRAASAARPHVTRP